MSAPVVALWLLDDGEHVVQRLSTGARVVRAIGQPGEAIPVLTVEAVLDLHTGMGWCPWCGTSARVALGVGAVVLGCCGGRAWPLPAAAEIPVITRPVPPRTAWRWSP